MDFDIQKLVDDIKKPENIDYIKKYAPTPDITPEKAQTAAVAAIASGGGTQIHPTTVKALGIRG